MAMQKPMQFETRDSPVATGINNADTELPLKRRCNARHNVCKMYA